MTNFFDNLQLLILTTIFCLITTVVYGQLIVPDTLFDYTFDLMETPAHNATSFAKSGNRVFSGTEFGLFFSDNEGLNWERNSFFNNEKIEDLISNDTVIFVAVSNPIHAGSPTFVINNLEVYTSFDNGITFFLNQNVETGAFNFGQHVIGEIIYDENSKFAFLLTHFYQNDTTATLYSTINNGINWDTLALENGGKLAFQDSNFYFYEEFVDTLVVHLFAENDFSIIQSDTLAITDEFELGFDYFFWKKADELTIFGQNNVYGTTNNLGQTWNIDTLQMTILQKKYHPFSTDLYIKNAIEILKFAPNTMGNVESIVEGYEGLSTLNNRFGLTAFFKDEEKTYIGNYGGVDFCADETYNCENRSRGISNASVTDSEGFVVTASNKIWLSSKFGYYKSSNNLDWDLMTDSLLLSGIEIIGGSGNAIFGRKNNQIFRSLDEGESWELYPDEIPLVFEEKTYSDSNYFIIYNRYNFHLTADAGQTWQTTEPPGFPNNRQINFFTQQDTFYLFQWLFANGDLVLHRHRSVNAGQTWQTDIIPELLITNGQMEESNGILYFFRENEGFIASHDWGLTWTEIGEGYIQSYVGTAFGPNAIRPYLVGIYDTLALIHADRGLWATTDFGITWKAVANLPFYQEYNWSISNSYHREFLEGGTKYLQYEDNLYIFTEGWGVWRTPVTNLLAAMSGNFAHTDLELSITAPSEYKIYEPIPYQITVENTGTLHATDIKINSPLPAGLVYTSDDVTTGDFNLYYEDWTIPELAAGESATLDLVLFPLVNNAPLSLFAQITAASPEDWDSTPDNNFDQNEVNEDDEAIAISYPMMPLVNALNWNPLDIELFPNPASEALNVYWNMENESVENLQIIGIRGKAMQTILLENNDFGNTTLDISNLETGVYFVQFQMKEGVLIKRFFKK